MRFHKEEEGAPCANMEAILQEVAAGNAKGLKKFYAIAHAAQCSRCGNFLERMTALVAACRSQKPSAPPDAMERLKAKLHEMEASQSTD